jgi:hypothetical protein
MRDKTSFELAMEVAEQKTMVARRALLAAGRPTQGVERLIDEADKAWQVVDGMLGIRIK